MRYAAILRHYSELGTVVASSEDAEILAILKARESQWTLVRLLSGSDVRVFNIAWGYDLGDEWAHITPNISPSRDADTPVDFFYTSEVTEIVDAESNSVICPLAKHGVT